MKLRLLSDIHGNAGALHKALQGIDYPLIQLGDFGWGTTLAYLRENPDRDIRFLGGNHEAYKEIITLPQYLGDFGTLKGYDDVFFVRGAWSIDKEFQMFHDVWCEEEELTYEQWEECFKLYEEKKPRIVLAHTGPANVVAKLINPMFGPHYNHSRTEEAMTQMLKLHRPEAWYFGHWHRSHEENYQGTYFRCLDINEFIDIEV